MNVNAALKAIYATQKQLDEDAHHSLKEYAAYPIPCWS
jgi:hypothetical protein